MKGFDFLDKLEDHAFARAESVLEGKAEEPSEGECKRADMLALMLQVRVTRHSPSLPSNPH